MRFIGVSETRLPLSPQKLITTTRAREKKLHENVRRRAPQWP